MVKKTNICYSINQHRYDQKALYIAASNGHLGIARLLIEGGAKIDTKNEVGDIECLLACLSAHLSDH